MFRALSLPDVGRDRGNGHDGRAMPSCSPRPLACFIVRRLSHIPHPKFKRRRWLVGEVEYSGRRRRLRALEYSLIIRLYLRVTLAEFSALVDAPPKWVLNTRALLGRGVQYDLAVAERLALVRALNRRLEIPLPRAWDLAGEALSKVGKDGIYTFTAPDGIVTMSIDVHRLRAALATRRSQLATMHQRRRAGRKPRRSSNALTAAREYGVDVTLLQANLERTPAVRLRQLDDMAAFQCLSGARPEVQACSKRSSQLSSAQVCASWSSAAWRRRSRGRRASRTTSTSATTPRHDNVERLVRLLVGWHAYLRGVERGLPFVLDARAFRTTPDHDPDH